MVYKNTHTHAHNSEMPEYVTTKLLLENSVISRLLIKKVHFLGVYRLLYLYSFTEFKLKSGLDQCRCGKVFSFIGVMKLMERYGRVERDEKMKKMGQTHDATSDKQQQFLLLRERGCWSKAQPISPRDH